MALRIPVSFAVTALVVHTVVYAETPLPTSVKAAPVAKSSVPNKTAAATGAKKGTLTTVKGQLAMAMSTGGLFGAGTSFDNDTGELVSRSSGPPTLMIEKDGKMLTIVIDRQTKLDDQFKSGMIDLNGIYRVTGYLKKESIVATAIVKD
jgi:hypothetical protein